MWWNDIEFSRIDQIVKQARGWVLDYTKAILQIEATSENKHWDGGHWLMW